MAASAECLTLVSTQAGRDGVLGRAAGATLTVHVHAPDPIDGLTLTVPAGCRLSASAPGKVSVKAATGTVILGPVAGDLALHFQQSSRAPAGNYR